jgi:hypothetical protein
VDHNDGTATLRLADYCLARIRACPLDLPCLNNLLLSLRLSQTRRLILARLRSR